MRLGAFIEGSVMISLILLFGAGCGGFSTSQGVSPLDFLIPHLGQNNTAPHSQQDTPSEKPAEPVKGIALAN